MVYYCPGKEEFRNADVHCLNSRVPPGNPDNLLIFRPISRITKAMKIKPKATSNHEKVILWASFHPSWTLLGLSWVLPWVGRRGGILISKKYPRPK